ncbi:MAG: molybdopterin-dependent oxidoreductase [Deltaproteobacteria bacterium]|nr:molybdopterin-dependent oxidoreductase [Deltaproteobacteria bacterium]
MHIDRRGFFKLTGGAVALGTVGCKALERGYPEEYWTEKPPVPGAKGWKQGEERFIKSACLQCEGGCGIVVRVVEGRAVKIDGNPDFPTNQGGLCPKGQNGLQVLYDPDRIKGPLARRGARGSGDWTRISWDEAIAQVARRLSGIRASGGSHTLAFLGGRYRGHMHDLVRRFLKAYGSPNDIDTESICDSAGKTAHWLSQGVRERLAYDWDRTRYVLSFGAGFIESFRPTAMMLRVFGQMRSGTPGQRAKIVQIEPRCSVSAARADEWVAVKPGTDGALALGIAHVMIRERLYDEPFVRDHSLGFERWTGPDGQVHAGFSGMVLEKYAPKDVARTTGVEAGTIERLAREFAAQRPAVAISGRGAAAHTNGIFNCLAIHALNALNGSIDRPGGVLVQRHPPFADWPDPELDDAARRGAMRARVDLSDAGTPPLARSQMIGLAGRIETGRPYPVNAVLLYYTNPVFSAPEPARFAEALSKVPLVVSFSPFLDDTSKLADFILPDHTYLERWQIDEPAAGVGFPVFSVRRPVVEPLHDTKSAGEAIISIARAIGGTVGAAFPWGEIDMIRQMVRGVHESGRGSVAAPDFDEFWKKLLAAGGWWDRPYGFGEWEKSLATSSGRYEFFATRFDESLDAAARARRPAAGLAAARAALHADLGISARGGEACLPHFEPVRCDGPESEYPFVLISYKPMTHAEGRGANQPHLQELFGVQFDRCWEPWAEIHPDDAAAIGVRDDDHVRLRSPAGEMRVKVVTYDGIARGVVCVPCEYGHTAYGRWAAGRGENPNRVVGAVPERIAGGVAWYDVRVSLSKA